MKSSAIVVGGVYEGATTIGRPWVRMVKDIATVYDKKVVYFYYGPRPTFGPGTTMEDFGAMSLASFAKQATLRRDAAPAA